jgi:hypothetical protein
VLSPEQVEEAKLRARYGGLMPKKKSSGLLPLSRKVREDANARAGAGRPAGCGCTVGALFPTALHWAMPAASADACTRAARPRRAG